MRGACPSQTLPMSGGQPPGTPRQRTGAAPGQRDAAGLVPRTQAHHTTQKKPSTWIRRRGRRRQPENRTGTLSEPRSARSGTSYLPLDAQSHSQQPPAAAGEAQLAGVAGQTPDNHKTRHPALTFTLASLDLSQRLPLDSAARRRRPAGPARPGQQPPQYRPQTARKAAESAPPKPCP